MSKQPDLLRFLNSPTERERIARGLPAIRIKTGSWFTPLPDDHQRIGISRGVPRRFPAGYRRFTKLNPGPWFNSVGTGEYVERYAAEILAPLDPAKVLADLEAIAGGKIPVLCCYERPGSGQWCHRALAARWLSDALGITVPEFGHEHLPQREHPLMAPELRRER